VEKMQMPKNNPMAYHQVFFGNVKDLLHGHLVRMKGEDVVFIEKSIVHQSVWDNLKIHHSLSNVRIVFKVKF